MKIKNLGLLLAIILFTTMAYAKKTKAQDVADYEIPWSVKEGEIASTCPKKISEYEKLVEEWLKQTTASKDQENFDHFLDLEEVGREFADYASLIHMIFNLHVDKKIREESFKCENEIENASNKISARTDIYQALKKLKPRNKKETRLSYIVLKGLEQDGALIEDPKKHKEFVELQEKLTEYSNQFSKNINDDKTSVAFREEDLEGVPTNVINRFEKISDGQRKVVMKANDYIDVVSNAKKEETRKKVYVAYRSKVGSKNLDLLKKVLPLREQLAELLGYKNWAEMRTANRMAKNPENVFKFYNELKPQFFKLRDQNLERLKKFASEDLKETGNVEPWNVDYYSKLYKKKYNDFDPEKAREYFPRKKVVDEMLKFYQELFTVKFKEIPNANVWHETVRAFEIIGGGKTIAYFYLDLEPREGKYSHQAAMNYRVGYKKKDGSYRRPIAIMMGNLTPEKPGAPALLSISGAGAEVDTLFHEFGHIMHQTLTKAPYATLAGANVYRDFVEAPSQMLENWVYTDILLNRLTAHYQTGKKIPVDLIKKIKDDKNYNSGMFYSRQLFLGTYDMTLNTEKILDPLDLYKKLSKEYSTFDVVPEDVFPAQFGHLMGYSAGYYSYLWSIVFAQDMFSKFEEKGVMNKHLGMRYRQIILEQGNMLEPMDLLKMFLGREPNGKAFIKSIQEH